MSFLAKLRKNGQRRPDNTQLCYLLTVDHFSSRISLRLALSKLQQGRLVGESKPYLIQRQHLVNLPAFLDNDDQELLQILLDSNFEEFDFANPNRETNPLNQANSINLQQPDSEVKAIISAQVFTKMLATGRSFIQDTNGFWQSITTTDTVSVSPVWQLDSFANYSMKWQANNGTRLFTFDAEQNSQSELVIAFDSEQYQMSLISYQHNDLAIAEIKALPTKLPIEKVSHFLSNKKKLWQSLNLPLPTMFKQKTVSAQVASVVVFVKPQQQSNASCRLAFRFITDKFCVQFFHSDIQHKEKMTVWDGEQLNEFSVEQAQLDVSFNLLANHLNEIGFQKKFSEAKKSEAEKLETNLAEWHSDDSVLWEKLLIQQRNWLSSNKFSCQFENGFPFHFVLAENWQANIAHVDDDKLQLDFSFEIENKKVDLAQLIKELKSFNQLKHLRENIYQLSDGRWLVIPIEKFSGLIAELSHLKFASHSGFSLPKAEFFRLAGLMKKLPETARWEDESKLLELAISLNEAPVILENMLTGVNAELRPYQWLGVCWLQHLKRHGVSGLLADDMGLGKTLQTLVHLNLEKQQQTLTAPALIIAPTSLLHNWASEIKKFTPQLTFKIMYGAKRSEYWSQLAQYDVVITSYQLILNDLSYWHQQPISWMILDEAQQIKNSKTQTSQAVRSLTSDFRLCLSGTPVENHLGELWSMMDFLMPGCLGNPTYFKRYFQLPIENDLEADRIDELRQRIAPFLLRRTKQQVATDLPPKTEIQQLISLSDEQMEFYQQQIERNNSDLKAVQENQDSKQGTQMHLLTALLKLRQACCDPRLLQKDTQVPSAKLSHCLTMIEELVAEKRAILVFSQFTSMLDLIAKALSELDIEYLMLTGKSKNRADLVEKFQRGEVPVFLISLKAGGVGLNLTQADTVIHFDPWWNSAAEKQASDRAHRIGQDKPVFVYKLIAENTIEQRIAALQQHKLQLSEQINQQAEISGDQFALKLEDLMSLWQSESAQLETSQENAKCKTQNKPE